MTVQELASKMNELMREGFRNWDVRITLDGAIHHPIEGSYAIINDPYKAIVLSSIYKEELIPITKADLENAQRAIYDPKE